MDMNFCQSLETLCLNFLKSAEFESEGERERSGGKKKKKRTDKKKCPSCLQTWEMPLSALCCLGVMQISSGCLSRLNRDQNRRWSNRYTAGRRSAATERTENTHTDSKICAEKCKSQIHTFKYVCSHIHKDKKHRHSAIIHKCFSQPNALSKACGEDKTATAGKFHTKKTKEWQILTGGRETTTERTQQIYAYT